MPSTESATITIVANTGWLIATRVIHMASPRTFYVGLLHRAGAAVAFQPRRLPMLQVVELGGDHILGSLHAREDLHQMGAVVARAGRHRAALEPAAGEQPDVGLRAFAAYRRYRQRGGLALGCHRETHAREHAGL